jgi:hypothetical protein
MLSTAGPSAAPLILELCAALAVGVGALVRHRVARAVRAVAGHLAGLRPRAVSGLAHPRRR